MNHQPSDQQRESDLLLEGVEGLCAFDTRSMQLQIHANDTMERRTRSQRFEMPAQLTVMLLIEGEIRVSINQTTSLMTARHGPAGYIWLTSEPGTLLRHIQTGQRIRKVNVTVPLEGLGFRLPESLHEQICLDAPRSQVFGWTPSPHALRCAQEIFAQQGQQNSMHSLSAYIAGLSMLQQALQVTSECGQLPVPAMATPRSDRDMVRAQRIRERILMESRHKSVTPQTLALAMGMSVSTLQRLFKAAYGTSIIEFQRTERLKAARAQLMSGGLTVGEASHRAGYSNISNFSSAFQRTFGYPPSACARR